MCNEADVFIVRKNILWYNNIVAAEVSGRYGGRIQIYSGECSYGS